MFSPPPGLFHIVVLRTQGGHKGGRNGAVNNLFGGLVRCGQCGFAIKSIDKGKPPKGNSTLSATP